MGDRLLESDVTKIGNWVSVSTKAKDLGGIAGNQVIAVTDKGSATEVTRR